MSELNIAMEVNADDNELTVMIGQWLKKYENNTLTELDIIRYWKLVVKHKIMLPEFIETSFEISEQKTRHYLINTIEKFICDGKNINLMEAPNMQVCPPSKCGRIFRMGELIYRCLQCEVGTTNVLCMDCFKQSSHIYHKHKIGISYGHGFCDCGDLNAWKNDAHCETHKNGLDEHNGDTPFITKDMEKRACFIFKSIIYYAYKFLTKSNFFVHSELHSGASEIDKSDDKYCVVFYYSSKPTFNQILTIFQNNLQYSQTDSVKYISSIFRDGRMVLKYGNYNNCVEVNDMIRMYATYNGGPIVKTRILHYYNYINQVCALKLLAWMQSVMKYSELRAVFSSILSTYKISEGFIIDLILKDYTVMWKSARLHWYKLFISGVLMDFNSKSNFAISFSRNIEAIVNNFIDDFHEYSDSALSLSVHLFTVPKIAENLIVRCNILHKLFILFSQECQKKLNKNGKLFFPEYVSHCEFKKSLVILKNITYLLSSVPNTWTDDLREVFLQAIFVFIKILICMQDVCPYIGKEQEGLIVDLQWEVVFNLQIKLNPLITNILIWCQSDNIILKKVYSIVLKEIWRNSTNYKLRFKKIFGYNVKCVIYDTQKNPVSMHCPLYRFFVGLHLCLDHCNQRTLEFREWQSPELIIEPVLRVLILKSQLNGGVIKRNIYSVKNQIYLYYSSKCRLHMSDKDIILLQIAASLMDSNEFLIHMLNKFNLYEWVHRVVKSNKKKTDCVYPYLLPLSEEFLSLIIAIVDNRYNTFIGKVTVEDCIKQNLIQFLGSGSSSRAEICNKFLYMEGAETLLEKCLNEVADFKLIDGKVIYYLKPVYYDDLNIFFFHTSKLEQLKLEKYQRAQKKEAGKMKCCFPPNLPSFNDDFANVINIMQCDVILRIIKMVLDRATDLTENFFTESQVQKVLYLIGYALYEEEGRHNQNFTFTERFEGYDIINTLKTVKRNCKIKGHKDLVTWILNRFMKVSASTKNMKNTINGRYVVSEIINMSDDDSDDEYLNQRRVELIGRKRSTLSTETTTSQNKLTKYNLKSFKEQSTNSEVQQGTSNAVSKNTDPKSSGIFDNKCCVLCLKDHLLTCDEMDMVLLAFIQNSSVLCTARDGLEKDSKMFDQYYLSIDFGASFHISSCGHAMHFVCYQKYFNEIVIQESHKLYQFKHTLGFNVKKNEYFCPSCSELCNAVVPLLPPISVNTEPMETNVFKTFTFENWYAGLNILLDKSKVVNTRSVKKLFILRPYDSSTVQLPSEINNASLQLMRKENVSQLVFVRPNDNHIDNDNRDVLLPFEQYSIRNNDYMMQIMLFQDSTGHSTEDLKPAYTNSILLPRTVDVLMLYAYYIFSRFTDVSQLSSVVNQIPLLIWKSCAYVIHTTEMSFRFKNEPLFGDLSCRTFKTIESLVRTSAFLSLEWKEKDQINVLALRFLSIVFDNGGCNRNGILDWDAFSMLVSLSMTLPTLYFVHETECPTSRGSVLDVYTFRIMFVAHIVQIILTIDIGENSWGSEIGHEADTSYLSYLFDTLRNIVIRNTTQVWNLVKNAAIPFLRCCSLFYYFLTNIKPPSVLTELNGDTYYNMCSYLGLPTTCADLFNNMFINTLIRKWSLNTKLIKIKSGELTMLRDWSKISDLVTLPDEYSVVMKNVLKFNCPNRPNEEARSPAMCLVCGKILCSESYCCQTEFNGTLVSSLFNIFNQI